MNDKIQGFVLSQTDYKESDVLMQVATMEYGIISLVGKASKKLDSKNHFLPMCLYEFIIDYKESKTIFSIHGSKLIACYFEDSDIDMMSFKNVLLEATLKNKDINSFKELLFTFENINKGNRFLLGSMYFSYLTKQFGIMPIVDGCVICGMKKVVSLSNSNGGFVCEKHTNGLSPLPVDRLKKLRLIVKGEYKDYDVLKNFDYDINDFYLITNFFLENSFEKIKAYDFYKTLN